LEAIGDFVDHIDKVQRYAGDVYQRLGPITYVPVVLERVDSVVSA